MAERLSPAAGLPQWLSGLIALTGLVVASLPLAVAGLAVVLTSRGGLLFRQRRMGLGGEPFTLLKLRTMREHGDGSKITSAGDERVTPLGRLLRRTKVDELPGLWNVVRGEMALVGPRPEVEDYVDLGHPLWQETLSVRPGLTDPVTLRLRAEEELLATVEDAEAFYRDALVPYKLQGYVDYVRSRTPWTDLRIILSTAAAVLTRKPQPPPTPEEVKRGWRVDDE